jgi:hypothetical protein
MHDQGGNAHAPLQRAAADIQVLDARDRYACVTLP